MAETQVVLVAYVAPGVEDDFREKTVLAGGRQSNRSRAVDDLDRFLEEGPCLDLAPAIGRGLVKRLATQIAVISPHVRRRPLALSGREWPNARDRIFTDQ